MKNPLDRLKSYFLDQFFWNFSQKKLTVSSDFKLKKNLLMIWKDLNMRYVNENFKMQTLPYF